MVISRVPLPVLPFALVTEALMVKSPLPNARRSAIAGTLILQLKLPCTVVVCVAAQRDGNRIASGGTSDHPADGLIGPRLGGVDNIIARHGVDGDARQAAIDQ